MLWHEAGSSSEKAGLDMGRSGGSGQLSALLQSSAVICQELNHVLIAKGPFCGKRGAILGGADQGEEYSGIFVHSSDLANRMKWTLRSRSLSLRKMWSQPRAESRWLGMHGRRLAKIATQMLVAGFGSIVRLVILNVTLLIWPKMTKRFIGMRVLS
ncbi:MAG: hypothetical protein ACFB11_06220 [Paracoccaceae bacterium]